MAFTCKSVADVHDWASDRNLLASGSAIDCFDGMVYFSPVKMLPFDACGAAGDSGRAADSCVERIGIRESGQVVMGAGVDSSEGERRESAREISRDPRKAQYMSLHHIYSISFFLVISYFSEYRA